MPKSALVVVDIINQYHAVSNKFPRCKINYEAYLGRIIDEEYTLFRQFAYGAQIDNEAINFITALRHMGFEPRYFPASCVNDTPNIAATDLTMHIAMDAWRSSAKVDAVIIGSNDTRLIPLIERLQELGTKVIVFACDIPNAIRDVADSCIFVDQTVLVRGKNAAAVPA